MESSDAMRNQFGDADPLLAFEEETLDPDAVPQNSAHSSATTTPVDQDLVAVLRNRITDAESVIQKSQDSIAALHTIVETLVCSMADLNKRLDRERNAATAQAVVPSLHREWQASPQRDGRPSLPTRVLPRAWPRVLPHRLPLRDCWQRVLPRDIQRALVLGTAMVMATLAIVLVALMQAMDAPVLSASTAAQAAVAVVSSPAQPPAITTPGETAPARQQPDPSPAQRVRARVAAPLASELPASDARPSVPTATAPPATGRSGTANNAPARTGQYVGTLTIDADPAGEAFVNRRPVGRTPVTVENLRAGSHLIWIERAGYRRWTRVVAVPANRVSRVSTELEPVVR